MSAQELPPIPDAYQRVEYVFQNGQSSMFDTGINGNNDNLRFVLCVCPLSHSAYHPFFGNYRGETTNGYRLMLASANSAVSWASNTRLNAGTPISLGASVVNKKLYVDCSFSIYSITNNNTKIVNTTIREKGTENNNHIAIGASYIRQSNTITPKVKWFYCKIYDGADLIRFYIPCYRKSDNAVGFYDSVEGTFNKSTGTGEFTLT